MTPDAPGDTGDPETGRPSDEDSTVTPSMPASPERTARAVTTRQVISPAVQAALDAVARHRTATVRRVAEQASVTGQAASAAITKQALASVTEARSAAAQRVAAQVAEYNQSALRKSAAATRANLTATSVLASRGGVLAHYPSIVRAAQAAVDSLTLRSADGFEQTLSNLFSVYAARVAADLPWPAHEPEEVSFRLRDRKGLSPEERAMRSVVTSRPPLIADHPAFLDGTLASALDMATRQITRLDEAHSEFLAPLSRLLVRTESAASSRIEDVDASVEDYARALHNVKANPSAVSMVAATAALDRLVSSTDEGAPLTLEAILTAHEALMKGDRDLEDRKYAGRLRDMQNWIGGNSPLDALFVPPAHTHVPALMDDLIAFANRDDIDPLAQAAIAHVQFESIHPFTDGNGRIGRALINAILRRRGVTSSVIVPIASALVANREYYFGLLTRYREGNAGPMVAMLAVAAGAAAAEARVTAGLLSALPAAWMNDAGRPRAGSATRKILDALFEMPVFTAEDVEWRLSTSTSSTYEAIKRLETAGVIKPLTDRKRDQVWGASALLDALQDLDTRIAVRATTLMWDDEPAGPPTDDALALEGLAVEGDA